MGSDKVYRVDYPDRGTEMAAMGMVVIDGEDKAVGRLGWYVLHIYHVRDYGDRRGFMPSVCIENVDHILDGLRGNGSVHHGTGAGAYTKAVDEGQEMMAKFQRELDESTDQYRVAARENG